MMTSTAFRGKLQQLGLSQAELARMIDIRGTSTVFRWARGDRPIPGSVQAVLVLIEALGVDKARKALSASAS